MSKFVPEKNYTHSIDSIRFPPRRLNAYERKILNVTSFRSRYRYIRNDCTFSHYHDTNFYSTLNTSFQKLLKSKKFNNIKLSNSKADWNMDLIVCSKKRYDRYYIHDKKEYSLVNTQKNLMLLQSISGVENKKEDILLLKIGIPFHSLCAIIFKKEKRIEIFDVSGDEFSTVSSRHRYPQRVLDFTIWESYTYQCYLKLLNGYFKKQYPNFYISRICNTNLQKHPDDQFCHVWCYYYFYKRVIEGLEGWEIMNYLKRQLNTQTRLHEITNFTNYLLYLKK